MNRTLGLLVAATLFLFGACDSSHPPASTGATGGASGSGGSNGSGGANGGGGADGGSTNDAGTNMPATGGAAGTDASPTGSDGPASSGGGTPLETVAVPPTGDAVMSKTSLTMGNLYLLRASGAVAVGAMGEDAKFTDFGADGAGASATGGGVQVTGLAPPDAKFPPATGANAWFGDFRSDHVYYMIVTGNGAALSFKLAKAGTGDPIAIALYLLTSPTSTIGAPLEAIMVPMAAPTPVMSKTMTQKGAIYVLEGAGTGVVGGGKKGDAEYDDFSPTGTGALEGEGGVDFGIGVDEPVLKANNPRLRKWGPIRNDHIYFMLFAGTGNTVSFTYYDSAYGDNGKTDMLTATIFAAP